MKKAPASRWRAVELVKASGPRAGSKHQCVILLTGTEQYGSCLKISPSGGSKSAGIGVVHVYRAGDGNPTESVLFRSAYHPDDWVLDLFRSSQIVADPSEELEAALAPLIPSADVILDALAGDERLPEKFREVLAEVFSAGSDE